MFALLSIVSFLLCPVLASAQTPGVASVPNPQRPELRAFWVDGFNDGFKTPEQCDALLAQLRASHCNAVFVQMRKRADAYYASHYEPWAADDPAHFDSLAYLCAQAHAPGLPRLQVHAWVNACAVGGNKGPQSLVRLHPDWLSLSDTGLDYDGESTKIDPGNPAAADWTYRVYLDIVRHYDIDGLHFDFIRYGGAGPTVGHWGYNPVSVARYNARYNTTGQPLWNEPRWQQWRRDQVTALVRRVSVSAHALKPHLIISAATIAWGDGPKTDADYEAKSASYTQVFAPWRDWLREGLLDLNCPMTYFDYARHPDYWAHWSQFVKDHQYGHRSAMGVGTWINAMPNSYQMIESTREPTAAGNTAAGVVMFSYAGTDKADGQENQYTPAFYDGLTRPTIFPQDVPPPPMPWLDKPKTGTIMGILLWGEHLTPIDGAEVEAENRDSHVKYIAVTDANGFFAFPQLSPGQYILIAPSSAPGKSSDFLITHVRVAPGHKTNEAFAFTNLLVTHIAGISRRKEGAVIVLTHTVVTVGSDRLGDDFYIADGFGKPPVRVHAPHLVPPTVAGDWVAVSGVLHHAGGQTYIDAGAVRQIGAILVKPAR